jgi:hypothetical protein
VSPAAQRLPHDLRISLITAGENGLATQAYREMTMAVAVLSDSELGAVAGGRNFEVHLSLFGFTFGIKVNDTTLGMTETCVTVGSPKLTRTDCAPN